MIILSRFRMGKAGQHAYEGFLSFDFPGVPLEHTRRFRNFSLDLDSY